MLYVLPNRREDPDLVFTKIKKSLEPFFKSVIRTEFRGFVTNYVKGLDARELSKPDIHTCLNNFFEFRSHQNGYFHRRLKIDFARCPLSPLHIRHSHSSPHRINRPKIHCYNTRDSRELNAWPLKPHIMKFVIYYVGLFFQIVRFNCYLLSNVPDEHKVYISFRNTFLTYFSKNLAMKQVFRLKCRRLNGLLDKGGDLQY